MAYREPEVTVIGGGPAGCEAAWQLAGAGLRVALVDMKPAALSPAHQTPLLCELVCSNSLRSDEETSPAGLLKRELRRTGSLMIEAADRHKVPAGAALAVERFGFAREVTTRLALHPNVTIERRVVERLPDGPTILATGPLTGGALADELRRLCGGDRFYFYDAIAPIVAADSVDPALSFRASRWDKHTDPSCEVDTCADGGGDVGVGDYLNCPLDQATYEAFVAEVRAARKVVPRDFEQARYFEGCLPIEVMAHRGRDTLRFGPMKPAGLDDPRTGRWAYAVVQLRQDTLAGDHFSLVGFQTQLKWSEQARVLRLIPGLEQAEFVRFGMVHRNTYVNGPTVLGPTWQVRARPDLFLAGQVSGVEGYVESAASGLLAGINAARLALGEAPVVAPRTTAIGALAHYASHADPAHYDPTNITFGIMPPLDRPPRAKADRKQAYSARALADLDPFRREVGAESFASDVDTGPAGSALATPDAAALDPAALG
jgi:methylenetetrahydrofolate--tRNA-(uracil-5-)-methyltransferase